jgi:para-aminobenzoate synthetase/4-amino-4-deoxychorismate lyase
MVESRHQYQEMHEVTVVLESFDPAYRSWSAAFRQPVEVHEARKLDQVLRVLAAAERGAASGRWAVVAVSYEAAPAFEPATLVHDPGCFPLAWVALFDRAHDLPAPLAAAGSLACPHWEPGLAFDKYAAAVECIQCAIARGDCYQVNYTFPLQGKFQGDAWTWYRALGAAQGAGYCAWLDLGRYLVMSLSPELFFEKKANRLRARPMKGTIPRGRWNEEDQAQRDWLSSSSKNRAENLMIVDLLRNDLGRVSLPGSVRVTNLFEIERYETLFQMTSTIESVCRPQTTLTDLFRALFPCGSVTGAPKISAMQIIRKLEADPRHLYTGTIGLIRPGGDCIFSVAIRTLILDKETSEVTFGVGGGITYDSTAEDEHAECLAKARFLAQCRPPFDLLETLLLERGDYFLLERHVRRIEESAEYFGFSWNEGAVRQKLEEVRGALDPGHWRVRLLAARDANLRAEVTPFAPAQEYIWRVGVAPEPLDSRNPFLCHKTTCRSFYQDPLQARPDCDDVIFCNERGEVTESSIANVVIVKDGQRLTPPRTSGLLAGTFRAELLAAGEIRERVLTRDELRKADEIYLINSVQKWMRAQLVDT